MSFLLRYLLIAVACTFMLLGMQLPNLADQYGKRLDASLREVTLNFQPWLIIANQHTGGSIEALIKLHRESNVAPFKAEGEAIERMYQRKRQLETERMALDTHLPGRLWHLLVHADADLREQTLVQYSATVPLNQEALVSGGLVALAALLLLEAAMALARQLQSRATRYINHRWRGAD